MGRSRASREREELEDEWSEEERWFLYVEVEEYCFRVRWMSFVRRDDLRSWSGSVCVSQLKQLAEAARFYTFGICFTRARSAPY